MRPTVGEQLEGTCRILEKVVADEIASPQTAETLRGLVRNLRMLERNWTVVLPFLHWDNDATEALLARAQPALPEPLAQRIDAVRATAVTDSLDVNEVEARNDVLRGLLAEVVVTIDPPDPVHSGIVRHLSERARKYPMRMVPDVPTAERSAT